MKGQSQGQANEPEFCAYNTRNFRTDLKKRLKVLALERNVHLEEMVNLACEIGLEVLEGRKSSV